ncbi:MAG: SigB/SigF/SigG family RNA polymerase sigma factor [Micromonosporaceae bacterium]|nr:SigB/SigF/SigG family RNA polymerase sigma factor [Micromonosporaceae bacterium]
MRIDVRRLSDVDVVRVRGTFDPTTAPRLRAVLDARLAEGRAHLVVDLTGMRMFDARVAGGLAAFAGRVQAVGGCVRVVSAPGLCRDLLALAGRGTQLRVYDDPAPVLAALRVRAGRTEETPSTSESAPLSTEDGGEDAGWPGSRDITVHALLAAVDRLPTDSADRAELRRQAIEHAMPLAHRLARRFRDRGEPGEDLVQVAMVGLVNAIDGYDPGRGCEFAGYATPTIVGELRRYFRDKGWRIRVPRRLQELRLRVNQASAELSQTQAATPTISDIANHLSVPEAEVAEAVEAGMLYQPLSLSGPGTSGSTLELEDPLGSDDPAIDVVEQRESVRPLLATLSERERDILRMRFYGDMTQSQIADRLGISQMHVSRLLARTLDSLRAALADAA